MKSILKVALMSLVLAFIVRETHAAEFAREVKLGVGGAASSRLYKDLKNRKRYTPFPLIQGRYGRLFIDGLSLGIKAIDYEGFSVDCKVARGVNGYEASDSPFLEGMERRKEGIDAGLDVTWWSPVGGFSMSGLVDITGEYDGGEVSLAYMMPLELYHLALVPSVGGTWRSAKKVQYYFGVRPDEARSDRPAYDPSGDISGFLALNVEMPVSPRWSLVAGGKAEYFGCDVRNSPLVHEDYVLSAYAGIIVTLL